MNLIQCLLMDTDMNTDMDTDMDTDLNTTTHRAAVSETPGVCGCGEIQSPFLVRNWVPPMYETFRGWANYRPWNKKY